MSTYLQRDAGYVLQIKDGIPQNAFITSGRRRWPSYFMQHCMNKFRAKQKKLFHPLIQEILLEDLNCQ